MKKKTGKVSGDRAPRSAALPLVLFLQLLAFAAAGTGLFLIAKMDFVKDFYSAHRGIGSINQVLLPAVVTSGALGFIAVAVITWLGFRSRSRQLTAPMEKSELLLQRLARGDLSMNPGAGPAGGGGSIDESAAAVVHAYREKVLEIQKLSKEIHSGLLSLRYKVSGEEPLTRTEIQEVTGSLDLLCKRLNSSMKWFET